MKPLIAALFLLGMVSAGQAQQDLRAETFCRGVTHHLGGGAGVHAKCMESERFAWRKVKEMKADPALVRACRRFAKEAGGSWQALLTCVHWQLVDVEEPEKDGQQSWLMRFGA